MKGLIAKAVPNYHFSNTEPKKSLIRCQSQLLYMDNRLGKQAIRPVRKRHMTAWEDECALKRSARGGCQTIWVSIAGPSKASFQTNKKKTATLSAKRTRRLSYYVCRGIAPLIFRERESTKPVGAIICVFEVYSSVIVSAEEGRRFLYARCVCRSHPHSGLRI